MGGRLKTGLSQPSPVFLNDTIHTRTHTQIFLTQQNLRVTLAEALDDEAGAKMAEELGESIFLL